MNAAARTCPSVAGVIDGEAYWKIKNSWNEQWGDGGTFKIKRGTDECGIEDDVTAITF